MRRLSSGIALAVLMTLGIAGTAQATTYMSCAAVPADPQPAGDVIVTDPGACSLNKVTATGGGIIQVTAATSITTQILSGASVTLTAGTFIQGNGTITGNPGAVTLMAPNGTLTLTALVTSGTGTDIVLSAMNAVQTVAITAGGHVGITSTNSTITINGALKSDNGGGAGNVLLQAFGNIKTLGITTNNGNATGGVEIDANTGGGSTLFTIGSSTANGVNGVITARNGVFINNGTAASTGGITITNGNKINAVVAGNKSGLVLFNAQNGPFVLMAGNLTAAGPTGQQAGVVTILAKTVTFAATSVVSAKQDPGVAGVNHFALIATGTLTISGTSLQVIADGDGVSGFPATAALTPPGTLTITSNENLDSLSWNVNAVNTFTTKTAVTVAGGSLTMTANGNQSQVQVAGYPVTFNNGALTLQSKGNNNHQVQLDWFGTLSGGNSLAFNNSGAVLIDASGNTSNDPAGLVEVIQDNVTVKATVPSLTMSANGLGTGAGGTISLLPGTTNIKLGTTAGDIKLSANSGPTGGNGGSINVNPTPTGTITIDSANAVSATAPTSGNGNGGNVTLTANGAFAVTSTVAGATINVNAQGTGNGGNIKILATSGTLNLGTAAGGLSLSASGGTGTGNGGTIEIEGVTLTLSNNLSVSAGTGAGGNGTGGTLNLHGLGGFTITGAPNITASGEGSGAAGSITVNSFTFATTVLDNATFSASGDTAGTGIGGQLSFTALGPITVASTTLNAQGGGTAGNAGGITLTVDSGTTAINLSTAHINANVFAAGNNGKGGMVTVNKASGATTPATLLVNSVVHVDGGGAMAATFDGSISLNTVTCQQYQLGAGASLPKYWNCANPGAPTANELLVPTAIAALPASFLTTLTGLSTYVFATIPNYNSFFATAGTDVVPSNVLGVTAPTPLNQSSVFEATGSGTDYSPYLRGNIMHEIGHLLDQNILPRPSGTPAFTAAEGNTVSAMTGTWPGVQSPTCAQVFGNTSPLCMPPPVVSPWQQFTTTFIAGQPELKEMFADGFQNCSNTDLFVVSENNALRSTYMKGTALVPGLWIYMNTTFWPTGCPRVE